MMTLALLMSLQAAAGLPIAALPRQELPAKGCAAYLFTRSDPRTFVAMASADPAMLRLSIGGVTADVTRTSQSGAGGFGFASVTDYAGGDVTAVLDMTVDARADLKDGAAVREATLRIDQAGRDSVVMPLAGIIGCAAVQ